MKSKKIFLVLDGNALLHRAWHAIPPLTTKDGRVVNAVYGFAMVIEKMRDEFKPDYMAVAWDLPGKTFRHKEFEAYKAHREKKADELYAQIGWIQDLLDIHSIPSISAEGFEADDVIGTLAKKYGPKSDLKVMIITGDMDALQLVDDDVEVVAFVKGLSETKVYDEKAVVERYGLKPDQLIDLKALMGDSSDNIPGIEGIGQKGATELLKEFGSIKNLLSALKDGKIAPRYAKKLEGQEKTVAQMQRLVTVVQDVKLKDFKISDAKVQEPNVEKLIASYRDLEFKRLLEKYQGGGERGKKGDMGDIDYGDHGSKKGKNISVVDLSELRKEELVIYIERGQPDLFGGETKTIVLFDGNKSAVLESPDEKQLEQVRSLLSKVKLLIGHDLKEIFHALPPTSYLLPTFDTKLSAYLLSAGSRAYDLDECANDFLSGTQLPKSAVAKAELVYRLHKALQKELEAEKSLKLAGEIEFPLISVLYQMELDGIEVDKKHLHNLSKTFGEQLDNLTKEIYKIADQEFNINSPAQLAQLLFEDLELPTKGIKRTKSGYSTAASELEKLWDAHKVIPMISEYREFSKLKSTYIDALPKLIKEDGRIHTTFNQAITATGRLSSSDPNLQNIPARSEMGQEIRKAFVAPKGKVLFAADYSQFELRVAAVISKDKAFLQAFKDGADIHRRTAAEILGKKEDDVTKEERYAAKAINFGILYGMGVRNLAKATGFSQEEAREFIQRYFDVYPGIQSYIDEAKTKAHHDGYVETLFGRRRYLPDIKSGIQMLIASAERMAVNMPVQGTQADLVKMAMLEVAEWIKKSGLDVKMLLQVHDELVFEVAENDLKKVVPEIKRIMEAIWTADVPLVVDCEVGKNWGEMNDFE